MAEIIVTNRKTAILGMGATGLSVAAFFDAQDIAFDIADSRNEPPNLGAVSKQYAKVQLLRSSKIGFPMLSLASPLLS